MTDSEPATAAPLRLRYLAHGTPGGYIDGCRCWSCRLGWLSAGRSFRRRVKLASAGLRLPGGD